VIYIPLVVFGLLAVWTAKMRPYTPGSDLGYYLGLVGGCMMASLLFYPLRKHWGRLENFGSLRTWFMIHMIFGICGPVLVLFHSTFQTNSFNATIAFWSMVIVTVSGVVGRFIFTQMYQGLEGKKASLREMEEFLAKCAADTQHALDLVPEVQKALEDYRNLAMATRNPTWSNIGTFLSISWKGQRLIAYARKKILPALKAETELRELPQSWYQAEKKAFYSLIEDYVRAIDITARYAYWERLLAWWQLAHVPLVYVLLITAVVHVFAVHRY
jgi:hypothetical protein